MMKKVAEGERERKEGESRKGRSKEKLSKSQQGRGLRNYHNMYKERKGAEQTQGAERRTGNGCVVSQTWVRAVTRCYWVLVHKPAALFSLCYKGIREQRLVNWLIYRFKVCPTS